MFIFNEYNSNQCLSLVLIISFIQMYQKKKNQVQNSTKKLNRIKSEDSLPIGSLMQQIGSLKEQLKMIKKGRKQQTFPKGGSIDIKENKQNKQQKEIQLIDVQCISREIKLKIELQMHKLRRCILSHDQTRTAKTINQIFEVFNSQIKQIMNERNRFKLQIDEMIFIHESYRKEQQEKYGIVMRNNQKLQQEIDILKSEVLKIVEEQQRREEQMRILNEQMKLNEEKLRLENQDLLKSNADLEGLIDQWELQCRALKEKCTSYEKTLEKKMQEIVLMEQDVTYLRLQSQKFKSQKKQFQRLLQKSNQQSKEIKRALEQQLEKVEREKNKWMNECSLRRQQSQQIQAIQSHKSLLFKEIQDLRNSFTLKCKQLAQNKALLHDAQRKIITLQSDNYKMAQQLLKAKRKSSFWEQEMESLRKEVAQLQSLHIQHSQTKANNLMNSIDNSQKKVREEKLKALQDIHNLIRQRKNEVDEQ